MSWDAVVERIGEFRGLADDWDGQGAAAPPSAAIDSAIRLAGLLASIGAGTPGSAYASPAGSIIFGWRDYCHRYAEIEVSPDGSPEWMYEDGRGEFVHGRLAASA